MNILFDTHTFLWAAAAPDKLSVQVQKIIATASRRFLSVASIWEIQIKSALGKLMLSKPLEDLVREQEQHNSVQVLPIVPQHIYQLASLPHVHHDPFDRILIVQAQYEHLLLLTKDQKIIQYAVRTTW